MLKYCIKCGKPYEAGFNSKRKLCDKCRQEGQEARRLKNMRRGKERKEQLGLKPIYIYQEDITFLKEAKGDKTMADFMHTLLTSKK